MRIIKILIIVSLALIGLTASSLGQTLVENKVDEFTKDSVKRTSWEVLIKSIKKGTSHPIVGYFRISQINNTEWFDLKFILGLTPEVFSIDAEDPIMFLLEDGNVVQLVNREYQLTCTGCGAVGHSGSQAQGISVSYFIDNDKFEQLKNFPIRKIRIYTSKGFVEIEPDKQQSEKIPMALKLIL